MEYLTQMEAARRGILTKEMKVVAEKEHIGAEDLMGLLAEG
ncbi:MAG: phosphomethylpyrimidine synthase ThiC [Synergistaceae bacterium]|nr:phosphomethylpyrimidine synthase ThiC [Synergistaceae bacterium]